MLTQTRRTRKPNRHHETVRENPTGKRGTHKLASIRPTVQATNRPRMYTVGKRVTIAVMDYRTDGAGPQFCIAGAARQWSMTTEGLTTTFKNTHGTTVGVPAHNVKALLKKLTPLAKESLMNYTTPKPYSLVNGWTGEVTESEDLTAAQATERNHRYKASNSDVRWVPEAKQSTVKAYKHNRDGSTRVMTAPEAAEYNAIFERQDGVRRKHGFPTVNECWEAMEWTKINPSLMYFV